MVQIVVVQARHNIRPWISCLLYGGYLLIVYDQRLTVERVSLLLGCSKLCSLRIIIIKQLNLYLLVALLDFLVWYSSQFLRRYQILLSQHLFL